MITVLVSGLTTIYIILEILFYVYMAYEKPRLIDLSKLSETGHGQNMPCKAGSGAGLCETGSAAIGFCGGGSGGRPVPPPPEP